LYALNGLGEAAHAAGDHAQAITHHLAALAGAADLGLRDQEARAHAGIGHAHLATGDGTSACDCYERALAGYLELGLPDAEQIRARLTAVRENARPRPER
jgi:tetratricopeptide (TPR) repeat protein